MCLKGPGCARMRKAADSLIIQVTSPSALQSECVVCDSNSLNSFIIMLILPKPVFETWTPTQSMTFNMSSHTVRNSKNATYDCQCFIKASFLHLHQVVFINTSSCFIFFFFFCNLTQLHCPWIETEWIWILNQTENVTCFTWTVLIISCSW